MKHAATLSRPSAASLPPFAEWPTDYAGLCREVLLPRPIHSRADCRRAVAVTDAMAGHRLNRDQGDYFELLCDLIAAWDEAHAPAPPPAATPAEVLAHLLEAHGLSGAGLARLLGVSPSLASRLLRGERHLTTGHITALCGHFGLEPAAFLP